MTTTSPEGSYLNPILPGSNPDPSITRCGKDFFLITSSFDFFPGLPIYHSTDLISWKLISHVLTRRSQLDIRSVEVGGGIWAPTIRYRTEEQEGHEKGSGGTFYVTCASFDKYRPQADERIWPRGWVVKCKEKDIWDEEGKGWSELVYFDIIGYDQDLFWDDDGRVYLSVTHRLHTRTLVPAGAKPLKDFAIHACKVDLATGRSLTRPQLIRASPSGISEGSHIFKRGKYYYLLTAEGGTEEGHSEWVCRSEAGPLGPWEVRGKVVSSGTSAEDEVQNTGHVDLIEDAEGRWWSVLLAVRPVKSAQGGWERSVFGRETFLIPVTWADDWPEFNYGRRIPLRGTAPGLYERPEPVAWRDDFRRSTMELGWYRKSTPQKVDYSLSERPGWLRLWGGPYTVGSPACATMWLRKQKQRQTTWETSLDFRPNSPRTEAGSIVWWNHTCYSSIGVRLAHDSGGRIIRFRRPSGETIEQPLRTADAEVVLVIECGEGAYRLGYKEASQGDGVSFVGSAGNDELTRDPDVGMAFTGMMLGLYAFGEMEPCLTSADFAYAEFR